MREKGITLISLIVTVVILIILIGATVVGSGILERADVQSLATDMLLIQTKVKIISEKVIFNGDTSIYVGKKLKEQPDKAKIAGKSLTAEEIERESLYIYDRETLDSIGLEGIKLSNGKVYIIDYENGEVIWPDGVKNEDGEKLYKLSEIINDSLIEGEYADDKVSPILGEPAWEIDVDSIMIGVNALDEYSGIKGYQFYIDGQRMWGADGAEWQNSNIYTFQGLTQESEYKIQYKVIDRAGNIATSEEYTIKTLKLVVTPLAMKWEGSTGSDYTEDTWANKNIYIYFAEGSNKNNTKYWVEGAMTVPETKEPTMLTTDGTYSVYEKVEKGDNTDEAGPISIKIDKTAPSVPNITEANTYTREEGTQDVAITSTSITDETSGIKSAVWYIAVPGASYGSGTDVTSAVQSNGTTTLNYTLDTAGTYKFKIAITDNANNKTEKETSMTLVRHVHSYGSWTKVNDTIHRGTCSCGLTQDQNHSWGSWVTTKAATHSNSGTQTATCSICNGTKTQMIAALGHTDACYSTACKGSFALTSTTSSTYYTCSHTHTASGNLISGSALADSAYYSASGGCYTTAGSYTCGGRHYITSAINPVYSGSHSSCCNAKCYYSTDFNTKCATCGATGTHYYVNTYWYCNTCLKYIKSADGTASSGYLKDLNIGKSCTNSLTRYGRSCGKTSGTKAFTRSVQNYSCATCGKTTALNLAASYSCSICGGTHAVSQTGSSSTTHNAVAKYLICGQ